MTLPKRRVRIQWTTTAKNGLRALPKKAREGLLKKADLLCECTDPSEAGKALCGPLGRYRRIRYSRYRAIFLIDEEEIVSGDILAQITILFVVVGKREEHSRQDVYRIAKKLVDLDLIQVHDVDE